MAEVPLGRASFAALRLVLVSTADPLVLAVGAGAAVLGALADRAVRRVVARR
ncbi:hypothetical protein ACWCQ0_40445 [Streptomyces massasporeus]|uniref:Uncharacterized protein n=1 Tax=Streptomyces massasporeus TaxID=67324 RepID=A0ABW6LPN1_9ACTN